MRVNKPRLAREALADLHSDDLVLVVGGITNTCSCDCTNELAETVTNGCTKTLVTEVVCA